MRIGWDIVRCIAARPFSSTKLPWNVDAWPGNSGPGLRTVGATGYDPQRCCQPKPFVAENGSGPGGYSNASYTVGLSVSGFAGRLGIVRANWAPSTAICRPADVASEYSLASPAFNCSLPSFRPSAVRCTSPSNTYTSSPPGPTRTPNSVPRSRSVEVGVRNVKRLPARLFFKRTRPSTIVADAADWTLRMVGLAARGWDPRRSGSCPSRRSAGSDRAGAAPLRPGSLAGHPSGSPPRRTTCQRSIRRAARLRRGGRPGLGRQVAATARKERSKPPPPRQAQARPR